MEYAVQSQISKQSTFSWWLPQVIKKRKEMANVRLEFEVFDGETSDITPGYQQAKCYMILDIKWVRTSVIKHVWSLADIQLKHQQY